MRLTHTEAKDCVLATAALLGLVVAGCATLAAAQKSPCPPTDLLTLDARFVAEAVSSCKDEQAPSADECRALPGIRAKYAAERARWVECAP